MSRKTKGLIVLLVFTLLLVMPVQMPCGHLHDTCVTAPGPGGIYYAYYEVEPFGVTLVEMLIGRNLRIYYWTGRERHLLHKNGMQSLNVSAFVAHWHNLRQRKDRIIFGG